MNTPLRIGVLGLTHDHVWGNAADVANCPHTELVAAADPHGPLMEQFQEKFDRPVYPAYEALLEEETLDAVYLFADNAAGADLAEMAAGRGLSILVEKPMAHSLEGADRMLAAARRAGVRLMVNWPFAWLPQLQHALTMAARGDIGDVWEVKYRAAHCGPENLGCSSYFCEWLFDAERNGAGALMDYCCYGAVLARAVLGVPARVTGVAARVQKEHITLEDNGVLVMTYPRGLAISEASWTQVGDLTNYVTTIYGSQGTLVVEPRHDGRLLLATGESPKGVEVEVPPLTPEMQNSAAHFAHALSSGEPFNVLCQARVGRDAQEILEAGLISAQEGMEVSLPLKTWSQ